MRTTWVSCPGKALLCGGYVILCGSEDDTPNGASTQQIDSTAVRQDAQGNVGVSVALSAYAHAVVTTMETRHHSDDISVTVQCPQLDAQ